MSEGQRLTRVRRTFVERLLLSDDELARGRELERIAAIKKFEAGIADADVENYYDQFSQRDAELASMERAEEFAVKFWREHGLPPRPAEPS